MEDSHAPVECSSVLKQTSGELSHPGPCSSSEESPANIDAWTINLRSSTEETDDMPSLNSVTTYLECLWKPGIHDLIVLYICHIHY